MLGISKFLMIYLEHTRTPPQVVLNKSMGVTVAAGKHCAWYLLTHVPSRIVLPFCNHQRHKGNLGEIAAVVWLGSKPCA